MPPNASSLQATAQATALQVQASMTAQREAVVRCSEQAPFLAERLVLRPGFSNADTE